MGGFVRTPEKGMAEVRWTGGVWRPSDEDVRTLRGLEIEWPEARVPLDGLARLAASGVPLSAQHAPSWVPAGLAAVLTDRAWLECVPDGTARCVADLRREEHSVRLRRAVLPLPSRPSISIVMSTMRPWLVTSALEQMAAQRHVEAEIVLGLHGVPFESVRQAVERCPLPVSWIEADQETPFGEVLNQAVARAAGTYVAKWDDDDWYGAEHLADLLRAMDANGADVVGTTGEFFYLEPLDVTVRRTRFASGADYPSEVWSDHVAGGTICLAAERLREIGGFPALPRAVDKQFLAAATGAGARIYRTHGLGYMLRRASGTRHTWQLPLAHFLRVQTSQWHGFRPSTLMERSCA
ncbi:glycosyltransferase [Nonomuraea soli]|uniref:Glycosyltransferase 2-like domain-containing protein n=1 Tax=Nonomuraea soli TaxID=1032476 RepID=A0A7W0CKT4_9ACTN|nr:glycosyltransferase [Nonomuraea soli]MBA2893029.1 hypothetical protein [Nonomuraea soli]